MWMPFSCAPWRIDPGPCPVDDTPHTACTPESVAALKSRQAVTVHVKRPRVLEAIARAAALRAGLEPPASQPARLEPAPLEFNTKTYRRAVHGRKARQAPPAAPAAAPQPHRTAAQRTAKAEGALPASAIAPSAVKALRARDALPATAALEPIDGDPDAGY